MVDSKKSGKRPKLVGAFIRQRREALALSQRALGQLFEPAVTTQFISNVERGVTPLPPTHVDTLAKALLVPEDEILNILEKEYAMKLSGRLGKDYDGTSASSSSDRANLVIDPKDYDFMRSLYDAIRRSDQKDRSAFLTVCESMLHMPKEQKEAQDAADVADAVVEEKTSA